jgi:hypothetical protein
MKALISSIEPVESGYRVAQVATDEMTFVVAEELFWVDCADDVVQDKFYFDPVTKQVVPLTTPPIQPPPTTFGTVTL